MTIPVNMRLLSRSGSDNSNAFGQCCALILQTLLTIFYFMAQLKYIELEPLRLSGTPDSMARFLLHWLSPLSCGP